MDRKISFGIPIAACLTIFVATFLFAGWFASMQIKVFSVYAFDTYPRGYFALTILKSMTLILAIFAVNHALMRYLTYYQLPSIVIAASYLTLGFVWLDIPIFYLVCLTCLIQLCGCYFTAHIRTYFHDGLAGFILVLLFLLLSNQFSPLHFNPTILASHGFYEESIPVFTPLYHQFIWAKLFSFSKMNYASWGSTLNAVNFANSPLLQILTFVLDIPSLDIAGFHKLIADLFFLLLVLGAFGFYLVLVYIGKLRKLLSVLISYLFFYCISPFLAQAFVMNGSLIISSIATLPYAILFMHHAFKLSRFRSASFAGVAFAAQFLFLSPYLKDALLILGAFICYSLIALFLQQDSNFFKKMQLLSVTGLVIILLSAHQIWPLLSNPQTYHLENSKVHLVDRDRLAADLTDCPYYLSLHAILSNHTAFNADNSNIWFIASKLDSFEKDLAITSAPAAITYKTAYAAQLSFWQIRSINELRKGSDIINFAKAIYPLIDSFYLNPAINCINRRISPQSDKLFRTVQYNFGSLYDKIPSRFSRIMIFMPQTIQLGSFPGYFINNNSMGSAIVKQIGEPLVTALYVIPSNDALQHLAQPNSITPQLRKLLDVGGIDIFTLRKHDLPNAAHQILKHTLHLATYLNPYFANHLQNYENLNSYGTAYFAHHIYPAAGNVESAEAAVISALKNNRVPPLDFFNQQLMDLTHRYDVILEGRAQIDNVTSTTHRIGNINIGNIVGDRALFNVDCPHAHCVFVYNLALTSDWHAFIDKEPAAIIRANFAFMAIPVTKGHHSIWFVNQSWVGLAGYLVSLLTLIVICCFRAEQHESAEAIHHYSEDQHTK